MRDVPMETREEQLRKKWLKGIEGFSDFGGFIGETADTILYQAYPEEISLLVNFYHKSGKGYVYVAEEVEKAFSYTKYEHNYLDNLKKQARSSNEKLTDKDIDFGRSLYAFHRWYVAQTARISAENIKTGNLHFWTGAKLSPTLRKTLSALNPLEERIIALQLGVYSDHPLDIGEIASSMEFDCAEYYIDLTIHNMIDEKIYPTKQEWQELQNMLLLNHIKEGR